MYLGGPKIFLKVSVSGQVFGQILKIFFTKYRKLAFLRVLTFIAFLNRNKILSSLFLFLVFQRLQFVLSEFSQMGNYMLF